ncbi:hypothetical protein [Actinomadura madurae]|uniref:hypothetical protein n=1 Tax=Actinomadura madurae TaxID=1993 RepID=UPI0020D23989|nr:hypothetical protein [Actinomadura madurae]MCP9948560.1 hypothetical protein [Actinomadura madurae]MCP9965335.1 hypothetical protein [Actinomadura madurae]MCQ0014004.1 hypothetical protein [Actinomadura madurae]
MEDHLPDEDVLTIPDSWRRSLHARRGGAPGPTTKVDAAAPDAVRDLIAQEGDRIGALREGGAGDPALTEAARRHLDGEADPYGAAVVAAVIAVRAGRFGSPRSDEVHRAFVDAWIVEHGVPFAACALVELSRTEAEFADLGTKVGAVHLTDDHKVAVPPDDARRVRNLLAAADEPVYAEAIDRLAGHRSGWITRWLVSYLVPTREDWVDECCTAPIPPQRRYDLLWMAAGALGRGDQLTTPIMARGLFYGQAGRALLITLADGLGADALPFLAKEADSRFLEADDRKRILETIALLPSDEAFQALLDRQDQKYARPRWARRPGASPSGRCGCWRGRASTTCSAAMPRPTPTWSPPSCRTCRTTSPRSSGASPTRPRASPTRHRTTCPPCSPSARGCNRGARSCPA